MVEQLTHNQLVVGSIPTGPIVTSREDTMIRKLDNIPVRIPGGGMWPPMDVFVNYRLVESTNVERVGWDDAGNMYVVYKGGGLYAYLGVSRQRAVAAAYARSVGRYINSRIKPTFDVVKL
jgi:hypothetical protein